MQFNIDDDEITAQRIFFVFIILPQCTLKLLPILRKFALKSCSQSFFYNFSVEKTFLGLILFRIFISYIFQILVHSKDAF